MFFAKPLQRSNLCASHRQRRWLTHGELELAARHQVYVIRYDARTADIDFGTVTHAPETYGGPTRDVTANARGINC